MEEFDIVIIGAGVAGLACAAQIGKKTPDIRLAIIEAQDEVGGRACSIDVGGFRVDAGAGWVHGVQGNPLIEDGILEAQDLVNCSEDNIWTAGPRASDSSNWHPSTEESTKWLTRMDRLSESGNGDLTIDLLSALQCPDEEAWSKSEMRFLNGMELWFGAHAKDLCPLEWSRDARLGDFPGPHAVVIKGMSLVAERLLAKVGGRCSIILSTSVVGVSEKDSRIDLQCETRVGDSVEHRHICARWLVCTVPLGALQQQNISISPALPQQLTDAIGRLRMSLYCKCFIVVEENFARSLFTWTWTDHAVFPLVFNYWHLKSIPVLLCSSIVDGIGSMSDRDVVNAAASALDIELAQIVASHVTRWHASLGFHGSYSFTPVGCDFTEVEAFRETMAGRRFVFAGEHTHDEHQGAVHGAYLSGKDAAERILECI